MPRLLAALGLLLALAACDTGFIVSPQEAETPRGNCAGKQLKPGTPDYDQCVTATTNFRCSEVALTGSAGYQHCVRTLKGPTYATWPGQLVY
jgi:hypothetical protein